MSENFKKSFVFVLGREQEIALNELKSVLGRFDFCFSASDSALARRDVDIYKITANLVFANIDNFTEDDAKRVMDALAGTVKIFKLIGPVEKDIASQIARIFEERKSVSSEIPHQVRDDFSALPSEQLKVSGKINFGISYYDRGFSRQIINSIALTAKKKLKGRFSLRYVESRDSAELSTILTLKNNLLTKGIEFGLFDNSIGVLVAFNNPEEWNKRDYGKPASDKFSGMVPPKLARMMVNLALGQINSKSEILNSKQIQKPNETNSKNVCDLELRALNLQSATVVDCFCGSGNILMEAMMLGFDVVGSDVSEKAVEDTRANLNWIKSETQNSKLKTNLKSKILNSKQDIFRSDATKDSLIENWKLKIGNYNNAVVVCEPYLGEPKKFKPTYKAAVGEYAEIKKLYLSFLKNILRLANSELTLCLIFPLVETLDRRRFSLYNESVDEIKKLGYTQACNSLAYGRDYQVVKREIILLRFQQ